MNETYVTVTGNVATKVDHWTSPSGLPVARFRLASTARRFDKQNQRWADASTSFYTVWAWRGLAGHLASSVARGEPVIVRGQLRVVEDERDGRRYLSAELLATTVGHDLTRGTSAFVRTPRANPESTRGPAPAWPPVAPAGPPPFGAPGDGASGERASGDGAETPGSEPAPEEVVPDGQLLPGALTEGSVPGSRGAS